MKMRQLLIVLVLFVCTSAYAQQQITTVILVRHAEKGSDGTNDPDLSDAGKARAESLSKLLKKTKVDAVYSTPFKRTKGTAAPLALAKSLTVESYQKIDELDAILQKFKGGTVVLVGHSNTTPAIANYLTGHKDEFPAFDDSEYGNVIVVSVIERGKDCKVVWLSY